MLRLIPVSLALALAFTAAMSQSPADADANGEVTMQDVHRTLSASCFNECWTYLDKQDRTARETETMILLAYASLWHWTKRTDCQPMNLSVGYWQVSRVHAVAGQYQMARVFGDRCLEVSQESGLPPFYIGYAYEALARAEALNGDVSRAREYVAKAHEQLEGVTDTEERALLHADLVSLQSMLMTN